MTSDPRRIIAAYNVLRDNGTNREACKASGLSYGTIARIKNSLRTSGELPQTALRLPAEPPIRELTTTARRLSAAILKVLRSEKIEPADYFAAPAELKLSRRQTEILTILVRRCGRVVSRESLFAAVWSGSPDIEDKNLDVQILHLRRKLSAYGVRIETQYGIGYMLTHENLDKLMAIGNEPIYIPPFLNLEGRAL